MAITSLMLSKTIEGYEYVEFIYCFCNCGKTKPLKDNWGRISTYIVGHNNRGKTGLKGGFYVDEFGYKHILKKDHIFADTHGYVPEHRLIYEEYYNCCLLPWAQVHHKNIDNLSKYENKHDNRIENLEAMTEFKHKSIHGKEYYRFEDYFKTTEYITNQYGTFKRKNKG